MQTSEIIRTLREKRGMTQSELAELLGYTDRSSIAKIETGKVDLSQSKLQQLMEIFNVPIHTLLGLEAPATRQIPILGTIACGAPILAQEHIDGYTDVPSAIHADFALVCKGDSMVNARIFDGDIVYIKERPMVENGEIAAVIIGDEATLKRVYYTPGSDRITLRACNPVYPDMEYEGETLSHIRILGKAVAFTSTIRL